MRTPWNEAGPCVGWPVNLVTTKIAILCLGRVPKEGESRDLAFSTRYIAIFHTGSNSDHYHLSGEYQNQSINHNISDLGSQHSVHDPNLSRSAFLYEDAK
jgi:hypothetical protein